MKSIKMKKISLKNILKKTFKKSPTKKKSISKSVKIKKVVTLKKNIKKTATQKVKKITKIKNKNLIKKNSTFKKTDEKQTDNLRIPKTNEQKPEIKKIKKQETEKKEYKAKDYVVYPKHGVGQILTVSSKTIGGIQVQCYEIKFEKDKALGLLPVNKQSNLRPLATINQVNKSISILKSKPKIKRSMWSRRAQEYEQKITSGKIYDLAEVVRDLNKGDDLMVDQSYSERQLFEKAYERILSEFQIVMNLSLEDTQKKLDKALKRNLNDQAAIIADPKAEESKTAEPKIEEPQQITE
jgi:CarD family transcriptional regulator